MFNVVIMHQYIQSIKDVNTVMAFQNAPLFNVFGHTIGYIYPILPQLKKRRSFFF